MDDTPHKLDYHRQSVKAPLDAREAHSQADVLKAINIDPVYYRKILEEQKRLGLTGGMEIGGQSRWIKFWRLVIMIVLLLIVATVFSFLFYYFTHNLRIALIVVTAMLVYMLVSAYLAEGNLDNH